MIDCHIHTHRSHHGKGDLEEFVAAALDLKLKVIGFSEHAPFICDPNHRITEEEALKYLADVRALKESIMGR